MFVTLCFVFARTPLQGQGPDEAQEAGDCVAARPQLSHEHKGSRTPRLKKNGLPAWGGEQNGGPQLEKQFGLFPTLHPKSLVPEAFYATLHSDSGVLEPRGKAALHKRQEREPNAHLESAPRRGRRRRPPVRRQELRAPPGK